MRTLVEVFCGLAALGLMVSFHHQIARLEVRQQDVSQLERKIESVAASVGNQEELESVRREILRETESRMKQLEEELANATSGSTHARKLENDLAQARNDVESIRSELSRDFEQTKKLVDAYIREVRVKEQDAAMRLSRTRNDIARLAGRIHRDPSLMTRTMLLPTIQLNGLDTVGSGTIVFSDVNPKSGKVETYALTSFHVVRNIFADTPAAKRKGFDVTIYQGGEKVVKAKLVSSRTRIDAALIRLMVDGKLPNVANVLPRSELDRVVVWQPVCAVGCPLGNDPVPSHGEISSLSNELNGSNYWMINAPTYFGNSGGGIYLNDTQQLIGVFSKIYTHGRSNPVVVPHMGLCTPIDLIYDWLEEEGLSHLLWSREVEPVDISALMDPKNESEDMPAAPGR